VHVVPEGGEFLNPEGFDLVEPGAEFGEGLGVEVIDADAGVGFDARFVDEAGAAKDAEVAAHGLGGETESGGDVAGAAGLLGEEIDDGLAGWIGEGGKGLGEHG
jgi:hypothetical protein